MIPTDRLGEVGLHFAEHLGAADEGRASQPALLHRHDVGDHVGGRLVAVNVGADDVLRAVSVDQPAAGVLEVGGPVVPLAELGGEGDEIFEAEDRIRPALLGQDFLERGLNLGGRLGAVMLVQGCPRRVSIRGVAGAEGVAQRPPDLAESLEFGDAEDGIGHGPA